MLALNRDAADELGRRSSSVDRVAFPRKSSWKASHVFVILNPTATPVAGCLSRT